MPNGYDGGQAVSSFTFGFVTARVQTSAVTDAAGITASPNVSL